jgi:propanol-preferring alcohol dehydrogenase
MVEALRLAAEGKVRSVVEKARLSDIAAAYERVKHGRVNGRIVIDMDAHRA